MMLVKSHAFSLWELFHLPLLPTSKQLYTSMGTAWAAAAVQAPLR